MNIEDIESGMLVRVKTFDELKAEGKMTHSGRDFANVESFGFLDYRAQYLGGIFRVEKISGSSVYLASCHYKPVWNDTLIWWHPDLLTPVETQKEFEIEEDSTEFSGFLDSFEVIP